MHILKIFNVALMWAIQQAATRLPHWALHCTENMTCVASVFTPGQEEPWNAYNISMLVPLYTHHLSQMLISIEKSFCQYAVNSTLFNPGKCAILIRFGPKKKAYFYWICFLTSSCPSRGYLASSLKVSATRLVTSQCQSHVSLPVFIFR